MAGVSLDSMRFFVRDPDVPEEKKREFVFGAGSELAKDARICRTKTRDVFVEIIPGKTEEGGVAGKKPLLVMFPGDMHGSFAFRLLADLLRQHGYTSVLVNYQGQYLSGGKASGKAPVDGYARDVEEALKNCSLGDGHGKKAVFVAHSRGGAVAERFVKAKYGSPDAWRLSGIVFVSVPVIEGCCDPNIGLGLIRRAVWGRVWGGLTFKPDYAYERFFSGTIDRRVFDESVYPLMTEMPGSLIFEMDEIKPADLGGLPWLAVFGDKDATAKLKFDPANSPQMRVIKEGSHDLIMDGSQGRLAEMIEQFVAQSVAK